MTTLTPTRTEASRTSVDVRGQGGRVRATLRAVSEADAPVVRPVLLASDGAGARVSLVPDGALLLAGDAIELDVVVGPGVLLELVEPGGTVAYDMRGGSARWDVSVRLEEGARLVWHGEPFVVATGAVVSRSTTIVAAGDARLALRETLVMGRHDERGGRIWQQLSVTQSDGTPLLVEDLALDAGAAGPLLGGSRCLGSVLLLGAAPTSSDALVLERGGSILRRLGDHAHEVQPEGPWRSAVLAARS